MGFWSDFASADNSQVHTPYVILICIGCVIMALSVVLIIYHCFWHGKGIDSETVKLILGLLGGGVINAGTSYFSKTTMSQITSVGPPDATVAHKANPAPPE